MPSTLRVAAGWRRLATLAVIGATAVGASAAAAQADDSPAGQPQATPAAELAIPVEVVDAGDAAAPATAGGGVAVQVADADPRLTPAQVDEANVWTRSLLAALEKVGVDVTVSEGPDGLIGLEIEGEIGEEAMKAIAGEVDGVVGMVVEASTDAPGSAPADAPAP